MSRDSNLSDLLRTLQQEATGDTVSVGDMVEAIEHRGFGPLIMLPALVAMLPTGAVPGVPTLMSLVNACICLQLLLGRHHPWIPRRLHQITVSRERFDHACELALPQAARIDRFIHPRLTWLTRRPAPRFTALACLLLGFTMIPLELLPFAAAVPAASIVLMGLALSARDGALILAGLTVAAGGLGLILQLN